jgi:Raf kinase inhibitor-like YbhB/YbcL family protein
MKNDRIVMMATTATVAAFLAMGQRNPTAGPTSPGLTLMTTAFEDGGILPAKYTQQVPKPVSPKLTWTHVPGGVVTFTLIMHDADSAPQRNSADSLHWMVFNIPGDKRELPEGIPDVATLPDGTTQGISQRGVLTGQNGDYVRGYRGPAGPVDGPYHHYTLELYALDTKLPLGPDAQRAEVLKAMDGHVLAKGVLVGRFHRTK